jgi:hypothetical protein
MDVKTALKWCEKSGKTAFHNTGLVYIRLYFDGVYKFYSHRVFDNGSIEVKPGHCLKNDTLGGLITDLEKQYWYRPKSWEPYKRLHDANYGGKRKGTGRKGKYNEKTIPVRIPISKVKWVKEQLENAQKQNRSREDTIKHFVSDYLASGNDLKSYPINGYDFCPQYYKHISELWDRFLADDNIKMAIKLLIRYGVWDPEQFIKDQGIKVEV